jgi:hypothetical protein
MAAIFPVGAGGADSKKTINNGGDRDMKVLIACEFSGRVRDAFAKRGHDAWSCDLLPTENPMGHHLQMDVRDILNKNDWDLMIAFPPCTHLASCGAPSFKRKQEEQKKALEFVVSLMNAPIEKIAIENPVGVISTKIRKPDQIVQPFWFGDAYKKSTCLWLKNLPLLQKTNEVKPEYIFYRSKSKKQGFSRYSKFGKMGAGCGLIRSITPRGLAEAMAEQWG